ncbi:MAG: DEAD/DEAH box helicase [Thermoplasmata archaeon]|uniref:DEAD/DEAH box helicase n=1 Tax=Candidatus Sysuiplasma superficiale TaxID=2823368 RepID=A0A8J7YMC8_9ARCH|nr:DEAD/DEAH box helicase [Candidatus Sysuiplasma superficiale]
MSLHKTALEQVDNHWAVLAVGLPEKARGLKIANERLVTKAVSRQIQFSLDESPGDEALLRRLAMAYEMAAIEGLSAFLNFSIAEDHLREQCVAGAWRAFELRRLLPVPQVTEERIFHVLHLSALSYCGDRWSDIRRWYEENPTSIVEPSVADLPWHYRLLNRLFDCWVRLFRKKGWDDLDRIREIIAGLREDQREYERTSLGSGSNAKDRAMALRLIAFYNWAKATELLAKYILQGEPRGINALLDKHFEAALDASTVAGDAQMEVLMRWLHATARQMVSGSLWWVAHNINSRVTRFVGSVTKHQGMFELLPPQRAALQEQGLLDLAATAVVIDLPTSGGKTLLAQFRILQALNQFAQNGGWVAYVVPTKALSNQITRRLRRDFSPIGVQVEQLTGAVEIDAIEEELLSSQAIGNDRPFDVLVATPEKLQLVIRNKKVQRPLVLIVMDEAHNIEDKSRGMRIELLLATVKQECTGANFLLLMPFVEGAEAIARWLANDIGGGRPISLGTSPWKPNEQLVGMFHIEPDPKVFSGWRLQFQTLVTARGTIHLEGMHQVGNIKPLDVPKSKLIKANGQQQGYGLQAAAMATVFSSRGTSIAVGGTIPTVWTMAREASKKLPILELPSERVLLVQKFLAAEISPDFELIQMLACGVGVHHAGLSDEIRSLIEWLTEEGDIRLLCATTTLAQGINFPVSSVFLSTLKFPYGVSMTPREFWNLAGRVGRMNQDSVGVIGIAEANAPHEITNYVRKATGEIVSRLVTIVAELDAVSTSDELAAVIQQDQWEDFRCYVNHLVHEIGNLDQILSNAEISLRNTYGYRVLQETQQGRAQAQKLLEATKLYARKISANPGQVAMADMTGFSFEGVGRALGGINSLEQKLSPDDFAADKLFGNAGGMADLYGIMLKIPQLSRHLEGITTEGISHQRLASITKDWVDGKSIQEIASAYFRTDEDATNSITNACRAIYRNLVNNGTWGLSALSRLSGINFEGLSVEQKRHINLLPAMIYHGVKTEDGVLMRMNGIPRSIAEPMGASYRSNIGAPSEGSGIQKVRHFLASADIEIWNRARPSNAPLSGAEYKEVWKILSGDGR